MSAGVRQYNTAHAVPSFSTAAKMHASVAGDKQPNNDSVASKWNYIASKHHGSHHIILTHTNGTCRKKSILQDARASVLNTHTILTCLCGTHSTAGVMLVRQAGHMCSIATYPNKLPC